MMTTLSELKSELAEMDRKLNATWLLEREEVRRRIADMAVEFQLNPTTVAKDIEAAQRSAAPAPSMLHPPKVDLPLRKNGAAQYIAMKFRNPATGDGWTGRGPRPRWLREALEAGAVLQDFLVGDEDGPAMGDPLRAFQDAARRQHLAGKG
jgi:DNA-binding protein H-NS